MSALSDRIRGIVGAQPAAVQPVASDSRRSAVPSVTERRMDADERHGVVRVGEIAAELGRGMAQAASILDPSISRAPLAFFDLETTGLNGGAGTQAFLVGCGVFEDGAFVVRQHLLARIEDEPSVLRAVRADLDQAATLVSFNGKSFDAPLLEMRFLYHRMTWSGRERPHLDVLHPARRFWGETGASCSLVALEQRLLGVHRVDDVPGFEIPARYFNFLRTGDARPLAAVLEHNRLDLLSLAALTARLLHLVGAGPRAARDGWEALALGRTYARAGLDERAEEAFAHAVDRGRASSSSSSFSSSSGPLLIAALRGVALSARRRRAFDRAATTWRKLLEVPGCPAQVACEAAQALAVHHEHRVRDLAAAQAFARRSLHGNPRRADVEAARHRLARIERKLEQRRSDGGLLKSDHPAGGSDFRLQG